jgi:2-polyprenyl-3-methyl-5-hydroxy-6-metoxy-1,4-benzoquinol methylase
MSDQVPYYNRFGEIHAQSILDCPEPEYWTTDYSERGSVYREMKERVDRQQELIRTWFDKSHPVLDIGCGFGRQAVWMAREGFRVRGTDTSAVFISIAEKLFTRFGLKGEFFCTDILKDKNHGHYKQVLLLDVLEHIPPAYREKMLERVSEKMVTGGILILSLPHTRKRFSSRVNNEIRKRITGQLRYFLAREEHPYTIPGKKKILKLTRTFFELVSFQETTLSDYYILRRL